MTTSHVLFSWRASLKIGGFVPAAECELTPVDNIMTRLGASDRILLGKMAHGVPTFEYSFKVRSFCVQTGI